GNADLMRERGVESDTRGAMRLAFEATQAAEAGATALQVVVDGVPAGVIALADRVRATSLAGIERLHREGLHVVMLTGDGEATARAVAAQVGIDEVEANVKPDQKASVVTRLQQQGRVVAMVGDGINGAPALA